MELIIIAAMGKNRLIGRNNSLVWQIPEDMAHFKAVTMGFPVILGRRTYQSIGGPLPGRQTVVVSASTSFCPHPDCTVVTSLNAAIRCCQGAGKVFVAGGWRLYKEALELADTLILTMIDQHDEGDTFFPDFSAHPFVLISSQPLNTVLPVKIKIYHRTQTADTEVLSHFTLHPETDHLCS